MRDDKTLRGWPLPYKNNTLASDVERLRESLNMIDAELTKIESAIDTKINALEEKTQKPDILARLGFYIDDDGDLAQDEGRIIDPDDGGNDDNDDDKKPVVLIDGKPATLATQADIQELLRELNLGQ